MGTISNDAADFNLKISLIRNYLGYYTNDDLVAMFHTSSLANILTKFTYRQIRARLVNTRTNTLDSEFEIGCVVTINKPVMKNGSYQHNQGVIIGKHLVYDDSNRNKSPLYHMVYDVLVQTKTYIDGYSYEVTQEVANDLILEDGVVSNVKDVMGQIASYAIDRPL